MEIVIKKYQEIEKIKKELIEIKQNDDLWTNEVIKIVENEIEKKEKELEEIKVYIYGIIWDKIEMGLTRVIYNKLIKEKLEINLENMLKIIEEKKEDYYIKKFYPFLEDERLTKILFEEVKECDKENNV